MCFVDLYLQVHDSYFDRETWRCILRNNNFVCDGRVIIEQYARDGVGWLKILCLESKIVYTYLHGVGSITKESIP